MYAIKYEPSIQVLMPDDRLAVFLTHNERLVPARVPQFNSAVRYKWRSAVRWLRQHPSKVVLCVGVLKDSAKVRVISLVHRLKRSADESKCMEMMMVMRMITGLAYGGVKCAGGGIVGRGGGGITGAMGGFKGSTTEKFAIQQNKKKFEVETTTCIATWSKGVHKQPNPTSPECITLEVMKA